MNAVDLCPQFYRCASDAVFHRFRRGKQMKIVKKAYFVNTLHPQGSILSWRFVPSF